MLTSLQRRALVVAMALYLAFSAWFSWQQAPLFDEGDYLAYAAQWAKGQPQRNNPMYDSKSPAVAPALLPLALRRPLGAAFEKEHPDFFLKLGRLMLVAYPCLALYLMFCWLVRLVGCRGAWVPWLVFAADPTFFSHGLVLGTDVAAMAMLLATVYFFWRFCCTVASRYWWLSALSAAYGLVVKASLIYAFPLLLLLGFLYFAPNKRLKAAPGWSKILGFVVVQLVVLNLAYYGSGMLQPFDQQRFVSSIFLHLQTGFGSLAKLPPLLPAPWLQGIDQLVHHAALGGCLPQSTYPGVWIFGNLRCNGGVWYYYLAAGLYKMPLLVLALMAAVPIWVMQRRPPFGVGVGALFVLMPLIWFGTVLSFFNPFQTGFRHALLFLPFLYLALAPVCAWVQRKKKWLLYAGVSMQLLALAAQGAQLMAFTNLLAGPNRLVYKKLRDTSIDYGQNTDNLRRFLAQNPQFKVPGTAPDTGFFCLPVARLAQSLVPTAADCRWLYLHFEPYEQRFGTILLYHVSAGQLPRALKHGGIPNVGFTVFVPPFHAFFYEGKKRVPLNAVSFGRG
jgi:hypothetical protein